MARLLLLLLPLAAAQPLAPAGFSQPTSPVALLAKNAAVDGGHVEVDVFFAPPNAECVIKVARPGREGEVLTETPCTPAGSLHHVARVPLTFGEGEFQVTSVITAPSGEYTSVGTINVLPAPGAASDDVRLVVETDKPIYKPGARIQTRVLAFNRETMPRAGVDVTITVRSPEGFTINRAELTTDAHGVVEYALPLSAEPPLGDYTISAVVGTTKNEAVVSVERYVLPKFEVSASLNEKYVYQADANEPFDLKGEVSATYTAGGGASGSAYAKLYVSCLAYQYGGCSRFADCAPVSKELTSDGYRLLATTEPSNLDGGKAAFAFSGVSGKLVQSCIMDGNSRQAKATLRVEAFVNEVTSGETKAEMVELQYRAGGLYDIATTGAYEFIPGLPYSLRASVKLPDGSPASGIDLPVITEYQMYGQRAQGLGKRFMAPVVDGELALELPMHDIADESESCCTNNYAYEVYSYFSTGSRDCCVTQLMIRIYQDVPVDAKDEANNPPLARLYISRSTVPGGTVLTATATAHDTAARRVSASVSYLGNPMANNAFAYLLVCGKGVVNTGVIILSEGASTAAIGVEYTSESCDGTAVLVVLAQRGKNLLGTSCDFSGLGSAVDVLSTVAMDATSATFPSETALPGDEISIKLEAPNRPQSRVFLLAVDKSVSLLAGNSALALSDVRRALETSNDAVALPGTDAAIASCGRGAGAALHAGGLLALASLNYRNCWGGGGVGFVDDMMRGMPEMAEAMPAMADAAPAPAPLSSPTSENKNSVDASEEAPAKKTRKFFPETWVFGTADLGDSTSGTFRAAVPDTMTTWILHSYGVSSKGLSLGTAVSNLTVSKALYVRASLPYSVLRDEVATVRIGIFNNLDRDASVALSVAEVGGTGSLVVRCLDEGTTQDGACRGNVAVPALSSVAFAVQVEARSIGVQRLTASVQEAADTSASDTIEQELLVEPPGETVEIPLNEMLTLSGAAQELKMETRVPEGAIAPRFVFSATGDLMGPSMEGIENLLQVPYGCGEQNMISMAPNVYVLDYLTATSSSDDAVLARALSSGTQNMAKGYQRQLQYMHADGSFSAFGEQASCGCFGRSDSSAKARGSTWLTAFVLRVFTGVARYTYVDPSILERASSYLLSVRDSAGAFAEHGRVIHKEMMGGVADKELSLTAYVLLSLAEAGKSAAGAEAPLSSARLVAQRAASATGGYGVSIGAYALHASCATWGESVTELCELATATQAVLDKLRVDGTHWEAGAGTGDSTSVDSPRLGLRPAVPEIEPIALFEPPRTKSSDVETTAYALLSVSADPSLADLVASGMGVVRWLTNQRNGHGGFRSTQDTVVALSALSAYAVKTASLSGETNLELSLAQSGKALLAAPISIDAASAKVMQRLDLNVSDVTLAADGTAKFELGASGTGTALVQLVLRYNKLGSSYPAPSYVLDVAWIPTVGVAPAAKRRAGDSAYPAKANVSACFAPTEEVGNDPGMVLLHVQSFSGYAFDAEAAQALVEANGSIVQRADVDAKGADLYVDASARGYSYKERICIVLPASKTHDVSGLGPAAASVQAYYEPATKTSSTSEAKEMLRAGEPPANGGTPVTVGGSPATTAPSITTGAPNPPPEKSAGGLRGVAAVAFASVALLAL